MYTVGFQLEQRETLCLDFLLATDLVKGHELPVLLSSSFAWVNLHQKDLIGIRVLVSSRSHASNALDSRWINVCQVASIFVLV